jgi:hypothetical protein
MPRACFKPYANEADTFQIGDLTVENRLDRISLFGSLDITLDKEGLKRAKELKLLVDAMLAELGKRALPKKIALLSTETVDNPFA